jgi:hypothetical protein
MSAVANATVPPESVHSWRLLAERIESETDPKVKANLEIVARHVALEVLGDVETLMTTLVPEPQYNYYGVDFPGPRGCAEVKAQYEVGVQYGTNRLEFELCRVVADASTVVTEGTFRHAYTGTLLRQMGNSDESLDPDGWYLAEYEAIVVWPIAETGLITGENVYFGGKARVVQPLAPGEMPHLGPVQRSAGG